MDIYFIVLSLIILPIVMILLLTVFFMRREKSIGLWSLGYLLLILGYYLTVKRAYDVFYDTGGTIPLLIMLKWLVITASGALLLTGTYDYVERKMPKRWIYFFGTGLAVAVINLFCYDYQALPLKALSYIYQSAGFLGTSYLLIKCRTAGGSLNILPGILWLAEGIVIAGAFLLHYFWDNSIRLLLAAIVTTLVLGCSATVTLVIVYLQKINIRQKGKKAFLGYASHGLKTQTTLISSYTKAIKDGVYPWGSLDKSIQVIDEETMNLEKRVTDLSLLNSLNNIQSGAQQRTAVDLAEIVRHNFTRFRPRRQDVTWEIVCAPLLVEGDTEQLNLVFENIFDNQLRYAKSRIAIKTYWEKDNEAPGICIWNDGPPIDEKTLPILFEMYKTGQQGEYGLGLAIIRRILDLHGAVIKVRNEEEGVAYYLSFLSVGNHSRSLFPVKGAAFFSSAGILNRQPNGRCRNR